ncbi:MAG: hypothetical protein ACE5NW_04680 [Acidiferrobacterales bacterium]
MAYLLIRQRGCWGCGVHVATLVPLVFVALSSLLVITPSHAREAYTKSDSPVFFNIDPDRALVYFANDLLRGTAYVYLDSTPVGFVPRKCYTAAMVNPGFRLVWGTGEAKWYEFRAGWVYLLRLVRVGTLSSAWVTDNPGMIRALVVDKQLSYVITHNDRLTRMRAKAEARYKNALKRAGSELALPYYKRLHTLDLKGKSPASMQAER